jgi:hypothetical protein
MERKFESYFVFIVGDDGSDKLREITLQLFHFGWNAFRSAPPSVLPSFIPLYILLLLLLSQLNIFTIRNGKRAMALGVIGKIDLLDLSSCLLLRANTQSFPLSVSISLKVPSSYSYLIFFII